VSEDILLAEAVFAHNSKLKKGTKISPSQLVKGKQSEPSMVDTRSLTGGYAWWICLSQLDQQHNELDTQQ